jgi:hypothetical protein
VQFRARPRPWPPPPPPPHRPPPPSLAATWLKGRGDELYRGGDFAGAANAYGTCLDVSLERAADEAEAAGLVSAGGKGGKAASGGRPSVAALRAGGERWLREDARGCREVVEIVGPAVSNRAACFLQLGELEVRCAVQRAAPGRLRRAGCAGPARACTAAAPSGCAERRELARARVLLAVHD